MEGVNFMFEILCGALYFPFEMLISILRIEMRILQDKERNCLITARFYDYEQSIV